MLAVLRTDPRWPPRAMVPGVYLSNWPSIAAEAGSYRGGGAKRSSTQAKAAVR